MQERLQDADVGAALRLVTDYQRRLEGGKDGTHKRELEYLRHLLTTPSFKRQMKVPTAAAESYREREDSVFETPPGSKKNSLTTDDAFVHRKSSSFGRNSSPASASEGKDRRLSSGSEGGSKEHTWLRMKKKKYKQILSLGSNIAENDKEEETSHAKSSGRFLPFKSSTSFGLNGSSSKGKKKKGSPKDSSRKVKSSSNLQESEESVENEAELSVEQILQLEEQQQQQREQWSSPLRVDPPSLQQEEFLSLSSQRNVEILTVSLVKPTNGGLGFSVVALRSDHKVGTFVQEIQPGGVADGDGRLSPDDEILSINGCSVAGMSQDNAIELLRSSKGRVDMVVARVKNKEQTLVMLPSRASKKHRRYNIETVELQGKAKSLGLSFAEGKVGGVEINDIQNGSMADKDGRLRVGDRLLQVNSHNAEHMTCRQATRQLQSTKGSLRLVIARVASDNPADQHMLFTLAPSYEEVYEVELRKDGSGLGIEIAGVEHQGLQGIVLSSIVEDGPAARTGRMRVGDQVLRVNGKDVRDLESKVAAAALRNSGDRVKLALGRKQSLSVAPPTSVAALGIASNGTSPLQPSTTSPIDLTDHIEQDIEKIKAKWKAKLGGGSGGGMPTEIKVVTIMKSSADGGLGVRLDGIQEQDDNDFPQGCIHHVIHTVKPDGPVMQQGGLEVGDELLEVNGTSLINLSHENAVQVIKNSPSKVLIVAAPYQSTSNSPSPNTLREMIAKGPISYCSQDDTTSVEGHLTSESEEDSRKKPTGAHKLLLEKMNYPDERKTTVKKIRAERESLREKYEAEKERLRIKIERNKKEYELQLVEQETLLREHQESVQKWKQEVEQQEVEDRVRRDQKRQELMNMEKYNDLPPWPKVLEEARRNAGLIMPPYPSFSSPEQLTVHSSTDLETLQDIENSEEDAPGEITGEWSSILIQIELVKGLDNLGFSLMHFRVKDTSTCVILVHDIVYGGVAHLDERLQIADQLVSINGADVSSKPLPFAANMLKAIESGPVVLGVRHALCCSLIEEDMPNISNLVSMDHSSSGSSLTRSLMRGIYRPEDRIITSTSPSVRNFHQSPRSAFHPVSIPNQQMQSGNANNRHSRSASEPVAMAMSVSQNGTVFKPVSIQLENGLSLETASTTESGSLFKDLMQQSKKVTSHSVSELFDRFEAVETRTCTIPLVGKHLGLSLGTDEVREVIVVKNIGRGGALEKDGRIRVGDQISSINGKSLENISVQKAKSTLKKATLKHAKEITLSYVPCPQGYVPKVSLIHSETQSASEPETPGHSALSVGQAAPIPENSSLPRAFPVALPHGSDGPVKSSPRAAIAPRTTRISSASTVIEHATTTDEDTSGSRENVTEEQVKTEQLLDLLKGADPTAKGMIMASSGQGPVQRAAKAKGGKKFPTLSVASLDGLDGSRDESGGTPDGLSPDFDAVNLVLPSIVSAAGRHMSHQHSRSTDAVKLRSEHNKRKAAKLHNRHSCDAIHMIDSSSSDSEADLGMFHHRRSGPRKKNGGGTGSGRGLPHPPPQYQIPAAQHHQRQGSHTHELSNGDVDDGKSKGNNRRCTGDQGLQRARMWMVLLVSVLMSAGTTAGETYGLEKTREGNATHSINKRSTPTTPCDSSTEGNSIYNPLQTDSVWICKSAKWTPFKLTLSLGSTAEVPASSCKEVLESHTSNCYQQPSDGPYWIKLTNQYSKVEQTVQVWCDMSTCGGGWSLVWKHSFMEVRPLTTLMYYHSTHYRACNDINGGPGGWCNLPYKARFQADEMMIVAYHYKRVVYAYKGRFNRNIDHDWTGGILLDHHKCVDHCKQSASNGVRPAPSGRTLLGIAFDKVSPYNYAHNCDTMQGTIDSPGDCRWHDCRLPTSISATERNTQMTVAIYVR